MKAFGFFKNILAPHSQKSEIVLQSTDQSRLVPAKPLGRHPERYQIIPSLADSDQLGFEWYPYIMRRSLPNYQSRTLNTDEFGFRRCLKKERLLDFDDVTNFQGPIGVISGNSTAYGIGASSDESTIPSALNGLIPQMLWYNFSHRASNLSQERINLDQYAPCNVKYVVFVSGGNNLVVTLLNQGGGRYVAPFVGEPQFCLLNTHRPQGTITDQNPMPRRYELMLEVMARDLMLIAQRGNAMGWKCLFMLQPFAAWCDRKFSAEEIKLIEIWDDHPSLLHAVHKPDILVPWKNRFVNDVSSLCNSAGLEFLDLNSSDKFLSGKWIFADRVHLTDEGNRLIAEIAFEWTQKQ